MELSGHDRRVGDYALFAGLGLRRLRVGLLWERHELAPDWRWADEHLGAMRAAGLEPIAGLVHHGSGPRHTSLLDPGFPRKLAAYAGAVARRYPHIDRYTPVNEPNTTARFSCLYGFWYPHEHSTRSYLRALLLQLQATVLSMRAIREVRSDARLIQTDDLGRIWSSPALAATCDLLNERRWLGFDLLSGRVERDHPLFTYLQAAGISDAEILWFRDHPCPPEVIGINYYLTSDRYLEHRTGLYPHLSHSGQEFGLSYLDLDAVRCRTDGIGGFGALLREAWERYGIATAITEVHLGSGVEDRVRWVVEAWQEAEAARAAGVECVAVTFWALLGSFYWNTLVTSVERGFYEPGVFDVSSGVPQRTALADVIAQLARGAAPDHPAAAVEGWWRHPSRIKHPEFPGEVRTTADSLRE